MRKIVFINQATGYLTIDILNAFSSQFKQIALITGSIRTQDEELSADIKISKIAKYNRGNNLKKALSWLMGTVQIYLLLTFKYKNYEKIFFTIPPLAYLLPLKNRSHISLIIYDIYPDALKVNGMSEKNLLYKLWSKRNKNVLANTFKLYTISDNMQAIVRNYVDVKNITVISNWSAFSNYNPIKKEQNKFLREKKLHHKFIIQYSGNIGKTHNVECLVDIAERLSSHEDIHIQIIGRGVKVDYIKSLIHTKQLKNCEILPFRPDEDLYESLCSSSLSVVMLDERVPDVSVPSKTYNIMAAGVPILAIASSQSSLAKIVKTYQLGHSFERGDIKGMCSFILNLIQDKSYLHKLSSNSYTASEFFSKTNAYKYLNSYLEN